MTVTHRDIQAYMMAVFIHINSGPDVSTPNLLGFIYLKGKTPVFHLCRHLTLSFEGSDGIHDLQVNLKRDGLGKEEQENYAWSTSSSGKRFALSCPP